MPAAVLLITGLYQGYLFAEASTSLKSLESSLWLQPEYGQTASRALLPEIEHVRSKIQSFASLALADTALAVAFGALILATSKEKT